MHDFKTTDYCDACGESPDSATHVMPNLWNSHTYRPPRGAAGCTCPPAYCAECHVIMNQGERERNPRTETGQPIHQACKDKKENVTP